MRWPFVLRRVHEADVARVQAQLDGVREELVKAAGREADWKRKAERLIDASLVRAGAIHEPTMVEPDRPRVAATSPFAGMAMDTIPRRADVQ